jgi:hypothetical protein
MKRKTRWYYKFSCDAYALGPTVETFSNQEEVKTMIRRSWGFKRLPAGTQVWRA